MFIVSFTEEHEFVADSPKHANIVLLWLQLTHTVPSPTSTTSLLLIQGPLPLTSPKYTQVYELEGGGEKGECGHVPLKKGKNERKIHTKGCQRTWVPSTPSLQI